MKSIGSILIITAMIILTGFRSSDPNEQADRINFYPFEGRYIDLETLEMVTPAGLFTNDFKTESKFAFRFAAPGDWTAGAYIHANFDGREFKVDEQGVLWLSGRQMETAKKIDAIPVDDKLDNVSGNDILMTVDGGVIRFSRLDEANEYLLKKYNSDGEILFEKRIKHTDVTIKGNEHHSHPYLYFFGITPQNLLLTSNDRDYQKTVVVSFKDGAVTEYDFILAGMIRDEDESNVPGLITLDEKREKMKTLLLNLSWTTDMPGNWYNHAETLMKGEVLYVSLFHSIATGSSLYAFNRTTGEQLWRADVKQLMIGHSEYYNTVYLSNYKNKIILEGVEAGGHYVQVFDEKTGERLYSTF